MLLTLLALNGVAPEAADPWRGWQTFKQYVRIVDEIPEPGVSVQTLRHADESTSLVFLRQVLEEDGDRLEPVGGVIMEFNYRPASAAQPEWEIWTFDHATFERFVDHVEQHDEFADLVVKVPLRSEVYWQEA
jgi:hypothetical protein